MEVSTNSIKCLPFNNFDEESFDLKTTEVVKDYDQNNRIPGSNNDYLAEIDPDKLNCKLWKKCKYNIPEFNFAMPSKMKCPASIIVTNIRSSNQNLKKYVNYISNLNITWTFIGITENWGKPHTICHMHIPCYNHVYDVRNDKIGGGCSLYIHDTIPFKHRKDLRLDGESVFVEINGKLFNTNKNVILAVIYRSPDSPLGLFNEQLDNPLQQIEKEKNVAFLSGDFNCDTFWELSVNSALTQDFINTFAPFNFHKLIIQPTRVVSKMSDIKSATLLDNFYTSTKNWEDDFTGILNTDESLGLDHKVIFTITENASIPKLPDYRVQRDLCTENIYKLYECYKNMDWNELYALETARVFFLYTFCKPYVFNMLSRKIG